MSVFVNSCYFDTEIQENYKLSEKGRFKNVLGKMLSENNISSILFYYDIDPEVEYWKFHSNRVPPKFDHYFKITSTKDEIYISDIDTEEVMDIDEVFMIICNNDR